VFAFHAALAPPARASDGDVSSAVTAATVSPSSGPSASSDRGTTRTLIGLALGEVGLAGLVAGTLFGLRAGASWSAAHDECPSSGNCPNHPLAVSDRDRAVTFAAVSTVSLVVAAAGLTAGAFVLFGASSSEASHAKITLTPAFGAGSGAVVVEGSF
jgi:hypothetical protein